MFRWQGFVFQKLVAVWHVQAFAVEAAFFSCGQIWDFGRGIPFDELWAAGVAMFGGVSL